MTASRRSSTACVARTASTSRVETTARRVGDEIQCSSRGVTERRAASAQLARRLAQQSAVARLGESALQRPDLDALFERTVAAVAETLGVGVVTVTEHVDAGTAHVRAELGSPFDALFTVDVPIGSGTAPLGTLTVGSRDERAFDDRDHDFLQAVAHVLAGAIERRARRGAHAPRRAPRRLTGLPNRTLLLDRLRSRARPRRRASGAASRCCSSTSTT